MAWKPDYVTDLEVKSALNITDGQDDTEIVFATNAANRLIDKYTGRQFGQETSAVSRYYSPYYSLRDCAWVVGIDDLSTTSELVVAVNSEDGGPYDTTLTIDTDFFLVPLNALADQVPYTGLIARNGSIPSWRGSIRVTAKWGWNAVPAEVEQAALTQALRFFKRKDAPFGIAGSPDLGGGDTRLLSRLDPDVQLLLSRFIRYWGMI